jgi:hypothetical protein
VSLTKEFRTNYAAFAARWKQTQTTVAASLLEYQPDPFFESYKRIVSLQAWRSELLEHELSGDALPFFLEAQNDALISHVLAHSGMWRPALQALRSCIENTLLALYYKDHPVELRLWEQQRLAFAQLHAYFSNHPDKPSAATVTGLERIAAEYATLSRAVHASARSFRMAAGDNVRLFVGDQASLGAWKTREVYTISSLNIVLLWMFRDHLTGTRVTNLRRVVAFTLSASQRAEVKQHLRIVLPAPA